MSTVARGLRVGLGPTSRSRLARCGALVLGVVIVVLDQVTKHLAVERLTGREPVSVIDGILQLRLIYNPRAAFNLGPSMTEVFTALSTVVSIAVVVAIVRTTSTAWALSLGVLLGGAVGNLVDRLTRDPGFARGEVVDFLELPRWPIFNVADIAVVTAAILIFIVNIRGTPLRRPPLPGGSTSPDSGPADPVAPAARPTDPS